MAELNALATILDEPLLMCVNIASDGRTLRPRIKSITGRTLVGETLEYLTLARDIMLLPLRLLRCFFGLHTAVFTERSGGGKIPELVTHHIFRDKYRDMLASVMNSHGETDEVRRNR